MHFFSPTHIILTRCDVWKEFGQWNTEISVKKQNKTVQIIPVVFHYFSFHKRRLIEFVYAPCVWFRRTVCAVFSSWGRSYRHGCFREPVRSRGTGNPLFVLISKLSQCWQNGVEIKRVWLTAPLRELGGDRTSDDAEAWILWFLPQLLQCYHPPSSHPHPPEHVSG